MLISLRVENHRSIRQEQVFGMDATGSDDRFVRSAVGSKKRLLPAAALYGANASGKSNVLSGLGFAQAAVTSSMSDWSPDGGVPRTPFAFDGGAEEPSLFELEFLIDSVRYQYGFVVNDERVVEEWLSAWPKNREQRWFERDGDVFDFKDSLKGENATVRRVTRSNALFLSVAAQLGHEQLLPVFRWFESLLIYGVPSMDPINHWRFRRRFDDWLGPGEQGPDAQSRRKLLRDLLRVADVGIDDFRVRRRMVELSDGETTSIPEYDFLHGTKEQAWLPLREESNGTKSLFSLGPAIVEALLTGAILVVDELDSSLHPLLGLFVIQLFNEPATNAFNAQLIFSSHDTNLLGTHYAERPLRRDQIWLTEKDDAGATHLYPLTDFKPRKPENLERGYLQGRYGAVPMVGELLLGDDDRR